MRSHPVAIVGGGITGLAAAWELAQAGVPFVLFERAPRFGGLIVTERMGPYLIDPGADGFLASKPGALQLCRQLGLEDRLVAPLAATAFVLRGGVLRPLPGRGSLGLPLSWGDLWRAEAFTLGGRVRLALNLIGWPRTRGPRGDESIEEFCRRQFGRAVAASLGEPLLAGIHVGDPARLSMRALFPRLLDLEARHGTVLRGLRRAERDDATLPGSPFRSFADGMTTLVESLVDKLPTSALRAGVTVEAIEGGPPYRLRLATGETATAAAVILAVPAHVAARLVAPLDSALAASARAIRFNSSATVVLAYGRQAVRHPLAGVGFVVPRTETRYRMLAATWVSSKWPGRAPTDSVLIRAFFGGERDPRALDEPDEALVAQAHGELASILEIADAPRSARVYRWIQANPQLEVGHLDRLATLSAQLGRWPGLVLAGAGYRGVGIPDCIADGRAAARAVAELPRPG